MLDEKERTIGIIKGYVEVNDDVENETSGRNMDLKTKELNESCKCVTLSLKKVNVCYHKRTIITESDFFF